MSAATSRKEPLPAEEAARAYCYALISRFFFGPPDRALVEQLLTIGENSDDTPLALAWRRLLQAARAADLDAVRQEYDGLFVGVGQAPVTLYTGHYAAPQAPDRHLVALREELVALNLGRGAQTGETEDHLSGVCDVMRWLIESGKSEAQQRRFFQAFLEPAAGPWCEAIAGSPHADFYRTVTLFTKAFFNIESEAFQLMEE